MITLHASTKRYADGFVPMIILRNAKGQCVGSRTPQGGYREFRTFTNEDACRAEAAAICGRIATQHPDVLRAV